MKQIITVDLNGFVFSFLQKYMFPSSGYHPGRQLFEMVANAMLYLNNTINFLLYCISGSRFRQEVKVMFGDLWKAVTCFRKDDVLHMTEHAKWTTGHFNGNKT